MGPKWSADQIADEVSNQTELDRGRRPGGQAPFDIPVLPVKPSSVPDSHSRTQRLGSQNLPCVLAADRERHASDGGSEREPRDGEGAVVGRLDAEDDVLSHLAIPRLRLCQDLGEGGRMAGRKADDPLSAGPTGGASLVAVGPHGCLCRRRSE